MLFLSRALFSHDDSGQAVKKTASDTTTSTPRRRQRRTLQYVVLAIGCLVVIDALVGDKGLLAMIKARQQYRALQQSLNRVKDENVRMRDEARRLREDPTAIEEIARRDLGLIRPGEKLFIVKDLPDTSKQ